MGHQIACRNVPLMMALFLTRFCNLLFELCHHQVGLGEGLAPSAATSVLARQIPATERSRAVATVFGGLDLGSAIGLLLCGPLIRAFGWPCVFYLFGMAGLMWCLMWQRMEPDDKDAIVMAKAVQETKKPVTSGLESDAKVSLVVRLH